MTNPAGTGGRLSLAERASYGFGDFGYSLAYNMAGAFLLYYYTNVVGLPAAAIGTIFLVARLLDAVIDPLVGIAVDKTRTRWGRMRPYFLFTAVPYVGVFIATFSVPDWSQSAQLVYAFLTFKALGIIMSLGSIPYTALMPMMTANPADRLKLGGWRSIGTSVGVILGTAATMPLVEALGGGDEAKGFLGTALLFSALSLFALTMLFRNCHERIEDDAAPAAFRVLPAVRQMLGNRAWLVCFAFCLLYFIRFGAMLGLTIFYAKDVLQKPWLIPVMLPMVSGGLLIAAFIAPPILTRTGLRKGCIGAIVVALALFGAMAALDHQPDWQIGSLSVPPLLLPYFAFSVVTSITITGIFSMAAASVDYQQWLHGVRYEGLLSSGISTSTKVGMAIGSALAAFVLSFAGYEPDAVTDAARADIRSAYFLVAGGLLALQALVVWFWPMDGDWRERPRPSA
ncbi:MULTISPECIES: MFS transporter [unclassified Novosphingobium]|uniref:MFS transporter n=1 Tax=unclassified Novosphingobium TaxID=2644732 RepID=UPI0025E9FEEE|nr:MULTISPECIES: glycoside-pentoside-hexuronide (GPH):cation symporter [unclassified Novosphingobium]HQS68062.1 glycoside-pentoside-hexuronide (GPH):cation symporter [Novosphingobium sp.]